MALRTPMSQLVKQDQERRGSKAASLTGRLPFRLGTTSYIIPADIIPNLHFLCGRVDDVELVLFDVEGWSNLPPPEDVSEMARIGAAHQLSYTVHLPLDTRLGSSNERERETSVSKCRRVMDLMKGVHPFAWILHLHGDRRGHPPSDDMARWLAQNRRSLGELLTATGVAPRTICVETLDYDFSLVSDLVEAFDLSVCLDIGHLIVNNRDVSSYLDRWWDRTRVFHLHGVQNADMDHTHLGHLPQSVLEGLIERLTRLPEGDTHVLTIEVFGRDDFERSMRILQERIKCRELPVRQGILPHSAHG